MRRYMIINYFQLYTKYNIEKHYNISILININLVILYLIQSKWLFWN